MDYRKMYDRLLDIEKAKDVMPAGPAGDAERQRLWDAVIAIDNEIEKSISWADTEQGSIPQTQAVSSWNFREEPFYMECDAKIGILVTALNMNQSDTASC